MKIGIINYEAGNLFSIQKIIEDRDINALRELYLDKWHTDPTPATIERVDKILGITKSGGGSLVERNPYYN